MDIDQLTYRFVPNTSSSSGKHIYTVISKSANAKQRF